MLLLHQDLTFLPKFLQNYDFRPCIPCFNTHENLKPKYKRFLALLRKTYFHSFLNISIWCRINGCVHISLNYFCLVHQKDELIFFLIFKVRGETLPIFFKKMQSEWIFQPVFLQYFDNLTSICLALMTIKSW